jgi:SAM-dependent methyltransferase
MLRAIQARVFTEYLSEQKHIYEFGCGTGHNLLFLRKINSKAKIIGLDWAYSSQVILSLLRKSQKDEKMSGKNFDYFSPDFDFKLEPSSAVVTVASLEQIGNRHGPFIDYLVRNKPAIVVHIEPFRDLLDEQNPVDLTSIEYMRQRNYIEGYCEVIFEMERHGNAKVHSFKRTFIGSKYVDGYTLLVWSPLT